MSVNVKMKRTAILSVLIMALLAVSTVSAERKFNAPYEDAYNSRIAFPVGGIGAGMYCVEGTGAISHMSVRGRLHAFNEPQTFAVICVKGKDGNVARVLEGPVPKWKVFGMPEAARGGSYKTYGFPRFLDSVFETKFPFAEIDLTDKKMPLDCSIEVWSPFVPGDADASSLPVGALEYHFTNPTRKTIEAVFSFNAGNFMGSGAGITSIESMSNGFVFKHDGPEDQPWNDGAFAFFTDLDATVDCCWFKGGWWDPLTITWSNIVEGRLMDNPPQPGARGASLFVPLTLKAGESKTVRLMTAWYVPKTQDRSGTSAEAAEGPAFGKQPSAGSASGQQKITGFLGKGLVNTFDPSGDNLTGTLTSPEFKIDADYIRFLIGGGNRSADAYIELLVDDKQVYKATGSGEEQLVWKTWDVSKLEGKKAKIRIVDNALGSWGHINIDHIIMTDNKLASNDQDVVVLQDFENGYKDWIAVGPKSKCAPGECAPGSDCEPVETYHRPWYTSKFGSLKDVTNYWKANYNELRQASKLFSDTFYDTTLPGEVVEAVAANLSILKSPTVLRQPDGRLWSWEGCNDNSGCCAGNCTHVWNYAQAICHLFPDLERGLRRTEFYESQSPAGHQTFRSALPIREVKPGYHAAADGQLGGILKVYREWRISGDHDWIKSMWPNVKQSLDYCIGIWDPRGVGVLEEPHHNTYDIEYWGPNGHCTSFYLGALTAAIEIGDALGEDVTTYRQLVKKGKAYLETKLYNGEYFYHDVRTTDLNAKFRPLNTSGNGPAYNELIAQLNTEGPKYQYGTGCLSDGVLGFWMARVCGLDKDIVDPAKVKSNLNAIYKYNLKHDLSSHANPQRPTYAVGDEGGLLLCTWPKGGKLHLPFVYSDEVWTGIEYSVASHLILEGMVDEGLDIVRTCRARYDGRVRNPFNEYECGHWYARAMSSYALIEALTGVRYDAVDKTLYIDSKVGKNFRSFLSTATGYASVGLKRGKPFVEVKKGFIDIDTVVVSGKKMSL